MENLHVTGYSEKNNFIILNSKGMNAFMLLATLLWQDKTNMHKAKINYNIQKKIITIKSNNFKYEFKNVPLQWDGNIDTYLIYAKHIQELKGMEVI